MGPYYNLCSALKTWMAEDCKNVIYIYIYIYVRPGYPSRHRISLRAGWSENWIRVRGEFSAPVHAGAGPPSTAHKTQTGSLSGVKRPGRAFVTHLHLARRPKRKKLLLYPLCVIKAHYRLNLLHTYIYIYIYVCMYVCMYVSVHVYKAQKTKKTWMGDFGFIENNKPWSYKFQIY